MPDLTHIIGVDPGTHTGVAVYDRANHCLKHLFSSDFWGAFDFICNYDARTTKIIVEVPTHAPTFWQRKGRAEGSGVVDRMARNVGQVIRESQLLAEGLRRRGYTVVEIKPLGKKKDAEFRRLTGWTKRTNQHERDAAVMAWGL